MRRLPFALGAAPIAAMALLPLATSLQAQRTTPAAIDRGSMVIDGSASLSRSRTSTGSAGGSGSDTKVTSTQISLQPSLLYFVAPRLALGGSLELARAKSGDVSNTAVGAGPAARLYFAGESATTLPYVGASARVVRLSYSVDGGSSAPSSTQWGLEGVAGFTWLFSRQVGIVTEAFASRLSYSNSGFSGQEADASATVFGLRVGVAAFIPKVR